MINKDIKIKIMVDNKACIDLAQNTNSKGRCKDILNSYSFKKILQPIKLY